ncbi:MAG TPA: aminotransferase class V-fold PLP-dependent enzyme [Gammaproteobacteria bacterium]|nr:aminotransferase class V-fold PLP-dependent enzyme [Gammaproteobacteria bacterium]
MYETEFQLHEDVIYLNHAAVAPWPKRTVEAVRAFAEENGRYGSHNYPDWVHTETLLREQLRQLLHARSSDEIALLKNTSEALSVVAWGLPWTAGDNVVISDQEFPSNRVVWESLDTLGVTTRQADLNSADSPEAALIARMDGRTRLLSVSSVQYGTGLRLDLVTLGAACRERDILFCVDAIQSLGAQDINVRACQADFIMADGHKWLLAPEGLAVFYCRQEIMERIALKQYGWHMLKDPLKFDSPSREVAHNARRFECGSPNMLGIHALHASLDLILDTGIERIEQRVLENSHFMLEFLASRGDRYEIITPCTMGRYTGIVTFKPLRESPDKLFETLRQHHVACALRGDGVRFSPHFYTPRDKLLTALRLLDE